MKWGEFCFHVLQSSGHFRSPGVLFGSGGKSRERRGQELLV